MKQIILFSISFLMVIPLWGQNGSIGSSLTSDILNNATSVVYYEDNGSVPPDAEYQCWITVTKKNVHFVLKRAYGEKTAYDKTMMISEAQYRDFVSKLAAQNIRNQPSSNEQVMEGASTESIKVIKNEVILFYGESFDGLVASKGQLKDAFTNLLREKMSRDLRKLKK